METSSKPFYDFNKMVISSDLFIFSGKYVLFLINSMHAFKRVKNYKLILFGF